MFKSVLSASIILASLTVSSSVLAIDLTTGIWNISAVDNANNTYEGTTLKFTSQIDSVSGNSNVEGYFDWIGNNSSLGREIFVGTFFSDLSLELSGQEILPPSNNIVIAFYEGDVTPDGNSILNGSWSRLPGGPALIPGNWTATRQVVTPPNPEQTPEPTSMIGLLALGILGGVSRLKSSQK